MILFGSWNVSKIAIKATVSFYCERQEKRGSLFLPVQYGGPKAATDAVYTCGGTLQTASYIRIHSHTLNRPTVTAWVLWGSLPSIWIGRAPISVSQYPLPAATGQNNFSTSLSVILHAQKMKWLSYPFIPLVILVTWLQRVELITFTGLNRWQL